MGRSGLEKLQIGYDPLPSQIEFHLSGARFKGFSGPVGSGKSQALCHEAIRLSYVNRGRLGLLGAPTYPMLRAASQAMLFEILESNHIPFDHNKAENILVINQTGSKILFRPIDEIERLRGTNLAWFGIDELTYSQEDAWLRLEARLRDPQASKLCGFAVWTPKGYDWVYRRFVSETRKNDYQTIFAKPKENRFLAIDYYEHLQASYDENFYRQEVLGEYLNLTAGVVYSSFSRTNNLVELKHEPYIPLLWTLDFNVRPMCSLIAQRTGMTLRVLDEIVIAQGTTIQACQEFLDRVPQQRKEIVVYGDASGYQQQTTGASDYEMIQDYLAEHTNVPVTYRVARANPSVRERINLTNAKLRSASGNVELLVDPKCKELIMDFEQVCFREDSYDIDKNRDRRRTHLSDALGYLVWQEFRQGPKIGERERRLV
jgi:Terminase large subunit, T4likevirus-type, N-terminal